MYIAFPPIGPKPLHESYSHIVAKFMYKLKKQLLAS